MKPYRRKAEPRWRAALRREMAQLPPLPAECPLCGQPDGIMHLLLWCNHDVIKKLRTKRHNIILKLVLDGVSKSKLGAYYLTGDLPGWSREDRANLASIPEEEAADDITEDLAAAEPDMAMPEHAEADAGDEEEYVPPEEETAPGAPIGDTEPEGVAQDEPQGQPARTILPRIWEGHYEGARRPDLLVIEGMRPDESLVAPEEQAERREPCAKFADPTCTSEQSIAGAFARKQQQYAAIIARPPIDSEVYALAFGVRGFNPHATIGNLKQIGIGGRQRTALLTSISRTVVIYCSRIMMTRRRLELSMERAREISGAYRFKWFRKRRRELKAIFGGT